MKSINRQPRRRGDAKAEVDRLLSRAQQQQQLGNCNTAIKHLHKAIKISPADSRAYSLLAHIHRQQGQLPEAIKAYQACLRQQPENIEILINLGMLHKRSGRPDEAISSYEKALKLRHDIPELYNNLGNAWLDKGDTRQAETAYRQAISQRADFAGAWHNLGRLLLQLGQPEAALEPLRQARQLQPDSWQIRSDLADCLIRLPLSSHDPTLDTDLLDSLQLHRIDGRALSRATCRYLRQQVYNDSLTEMLNGSLTVDEHLLTSLRQPILLALLQREPLCDWTLEQFLTQVRAQLLKQPLLLSSAELLQFLAALARQCFLNEYLWNITPGEEHQLHALEAQLGNQPVTDAHVNELCLYACYRPLAILIPATQAKTLLGHVCEPLARLLQQQIINPAIEAGYRAELPVLTGIEDGTSQKVRDQYEANPYPRWQMLDKPDGYALGDYLCLLFPWLRRLPPRFSKQPDILCAGCGTGLQALRMARRIPAAKISAIDMSRASLAYGRRQAVANGHDDIRFAQADILDLDDNCGRYDAIECYGVLHHLADPLAGWQSLRRRLKPGGVMRIGLYSHAAREPIRRIRELIDEQHISPDVDGIRSIRRHIAALPVTDPVHSLIHSPDFYSVSECRDLMFHVQEHQLDLLSIAAILDKLDLDFLGFEFDDYSTLDQYRASYPDDPHAVDLNHWHEYETAHPDTFAAQYIFWVRSRH